MSTQLTAGPVWVKASERLPEKGVIKAAFYNGRYRNMFVHDNGIIEVDGLRSYTKEILQEWFPGIEWLDKSNPQQVFTREQVSQAFADGVIAAGSRAAKKPFYTEQEYMALNYPPIN